MKYPEYPISKPSGINWIGDIPEHWNVKRLRFSCKVNPSKSEVAHLSADVELTFLPMENIGEDGELNLEEIRGLDDVYQNGFTYFAENDVLVAKITPCFENGKGALARGLTNQLGFGTTELHVIRTNQEVSPEYMWFVTKSQLFRATGEAMMIGSAGQKRVPERFIKDYPLCFPDIDEQRIIVKFLNRKTAEIDLVIEKRQRLIRLLEEKRMALVTQAVTKGLDPEVKLRPSSVDWLGDVPEHWECRRIAMIASKITNGYVGPTRDLFVDEGVAYLQSLHIKSNSVRFTPPYYVPDWWSREHSKSILAKGDVLVVQTGDIGQVACVPAAYEGANCHALIIISCQKSLMAGEYLAWVLNSTYGYNSLKRIQTGALHPHLNCTLVRDIRVPVPPVDEQRKIATFLDKKTTYIDLLLRKLQEHIEKLRQYRSTLISEAVIGKIDIREVVA